MGIKGLSSNRKKTLKSSKSTKWHRTLNAERKKHLPAESVDIENLHLFSKEKLKNKLKNPKNNIKISGKKLRRLTKRLGHSLREKSCMDVEVSDTRTRQVADSQDAQMAEAGTEPEAAAVSSESSSLPPPPSSSSSSSRKKKRNRGGKKHKNKVPGGDEKVFENDNEWEDVDMGEG